MTKSPNSLATALVLNTTNYSQTDLANLANNLQPLLSGSANRILADSNHRFGEAMIDRTFDPKKTLWAKVTGNQGKLKASNNGLTGFDNKEIGVIVGADTDIHNSSLGVAVAVSQNDSDSVGYVNHTAKTDNLMGFVYGTHNNDKTTIHGHIGAGIANIDGERRITQINKVAKSDYDAKIVQAGLGVRHQIGTADRHIVPFAKVDFSHIKSDSYSETGADAYNLNVAKADYQNLRGTLGLRAHTAITPRFTLTGLASVGVNSGDTRSNIHADFASFKGHTFGVLGHEVGKTVAIAGLGMAYRPTINTQFFFDYQAEWQKNYDNQSVVLGFEKKF